MNNAIREGHELITKSGLQYAVCGGFAIEMFLNRAIRKHTDYDITIFEENRKDILNFMLGQGWKIFDHVWDTAGTDYLVAIYSADDERALTVDCVWALKPGGTFVTVEPKDAENNIFGWKLTSNEVKECDFIEICFDKKDNHNFICNKERNIVRPLNKAILYNDGIPYLAPEIILYHKSAPVYMTWPKTIFDFYHTAHVLDGESKDWLINALKAAYPEGHEWIERM